MRFIYHLIFGIFFLIVVLPLLVFGVLQFIKSKSLETYNFFIRVFKFIGNGILTFWGKDITPMYFTLLPYDEAGYVRQAELNTFIRRVLDKFFLGILAVGSGYRGNIYFVSYSFVSIIDSRFIADYNILNRIVYADLIALYEDTYDLDSYTLKKMFCVIIYPNTNTLVVGFSLSAQGEAKIMELKSKYNVL